MANKAICSEYDTIHIGAYLESNGDDVPFAIGLISYGIILFSTECYCLYDLQLLLHYSLVFLVEGEQYCY
jgi:hypothetical protein